MLRRVLAAVAAAAVLAGCSSSPGPAPSTVATASRTLAFRAVGPGGAPATAAQLDQAAKIMRLRLDGLRIAPVAVTVTGDGLSATVPVGAEDQTREASRVGQLRLRPKLAGPYPGGDNTFTGADPRQVIQLSELDCAAGARPGDDPKVPLAACMEKDRYLFGPAIIDGADIARATPAVDQQVGQWMITITFSERGRSAWSTYTGQHNTSVTPQDPGNAVGFVLDGVVLSVPEIQGRIDGDTQVSGNFTQKSAAALANAITSGALPVTLESA